MADSIIRYTVCWVDGVRHLVAVYRREDGGERWETIWTEGYS
jgi:uncharacterized protein YigE (DUF2233 family)